MTVAVAEQNKLAELAETEKIIEVRKRYRERHEKIYADTDIESLIWTLSGLCGTNVHVENEADMYFGLLDFRDFVLEKYDILSEDERIKHKKDMEIVLKETDEELESLKNIVLQS